MIYTISHHLFTLIEWSYFKIFDRKLKYACFVKNKKKWKKVKK